MRPFFQLFRLWGLIVKTTWTYFRIQYQPKNVPVLPIDTQIELKFQPSIKGLYFYMLAHAYTFYHGCRWSISLDRQRFELLMATFRGMIHDSMEFFLSSPTTIQRRFSYNPLLWIVYVFDRPINCYPSLHISLNVLTYHLSLVFDAPTSEQMSKKRALCRRICRSTMETGQHGAIDVIGGFVCARSAFLYFFSEHQHMWQSDFLFDVLPVLSSEERKIIESNISQLENAGQVFPHLLALRNVA